MTGSAGPESASKVFLTGASGELGRPTVSRLISEGHQVICASRSDSADRIIADLGGTPTRVDLFDAGALRQAVGDAEAVLHLATAIRPSAEMGDLSTWVTNDRVREETTAHLADAVAANGARSLLLQSYFGVRAPDGGHRRMSVRRACRRSHADIVTRTSPCCSSSENPVLPDAL